MSFCDLDDPIRIARDGFGKSTPIRVLKHPNNKLPSKNLNLLENSVHLLRFRFNANNATMLDKPIRDTIYLTFKQKRAKLKNNFITKERTEVRNKFKNIQKYSGNPFLKEASIIEENFGTYQSQYKLVKKAKHRAGVIRVAG
jgi:hypothetical protein